jgi:hypothetical protein
LKSGRARDEQSALYSRDRETETWFKKRKLYDEIGTEGKYSKFQRMSLIVDFNVNVSAYTEF